MALWTHGHWPPRDTGASDLLLGIPGVMNGSSMTALCHWHKRSTGYHDTHRRSAGYVAGCESLDIHLVLGATLHLLGITKLGMYCPRACPKAIGSKNDRNVYNKHGSCNELNLSQVPSTYARVGRAPSRVGALGGRHTPETDDVGVVYMSLETRCA